MASIPKQSNTMTKVSCRRAVKNIAKIWLKFQLLVEGINRFIVHHLQYIFQNFPGGGGMPPDPPSSLITFSNTAWSVFPLIGLAIKP